MNSNLPNDPVMLLSYVNTQLRDHYASLQDFCKSLDIEEQELAGRLAGIQYEYDAKANQFK